ncbi:hypothetical protein CDAR_97411 [Caerostris darwini]|uniref:Uncharacterized protein n=1 Tax=Caerostris darwini TaxID=1538125 RepID=A0AAV4PPQ7_9ARAC|nr:hypothetical protein CDAR_97411 [Caerostris darwini]
MTTKSLDKSTLCDPKQTDENRTYNLSPKNNYQVRSENVRKSYFSLEENRRLCHLQKKASPSHGETNDEKRNLFSKKTNWLLGEEAFDELSVEFLSSKHLFPFRHPQYIDRPRRESLFELEENYFLAKSFLDTILKDVYVNRACSECLEQFCSVLNGNL